MKTNILVMVISIMFIAVMIKVGISSAMENEQTTKVKNLIQQNISQIKEHARNPDKPISHIEITDKDLSEADAYEILNVLKPYKEDNEFPVKERAFRLEVRLATLH